ncbi:hypothetical protein Q1695_009054 [Nippostrongylus brasiliensis]|nr:hypothetical protein Q1695_009054 [Nippostrongylus brasiliensis]
MGCSRFYRAGQRAAEIGGWQETCRPSAGNSGQCDRARQSADADGEGRRREKTARRPANRGRRPESASQRRSQSPPIGSSKSTVRANQHAELMALAYAAEKCVRSLMLIIY